MRVDYGEDYLDDEDYDDSFQKIGRTSKAPKQKQYKKVVKQDFRKEKLAKRKSQEEAEDSSY